MHTQAHTQTQEYALPLGARHDVILKAPRVAPMGDILAATLRHSHPSPDRTVCIEHAWTPSIELIRLGWNRQYRD